MTYLNQAFQNCRHWSNPYREKSGPSITDIGLVFAICCLGGKVWWRHLRAKCKHNRGPRGGKFEVARSSSSCRYFSTHNFVTAATVADVDATFQYCWLIDQQRLLNGILRKRWLERIIHLITWTSARPDIDNEMPIYQRTSCAVEQQFYQLFSGERPEF